MRHQRSWGYRRKGDIQTAFQVCISASRLRLVPAQVALQRRRFVAADYKPEIPKFTANENMGMVERNNSRVGQDPGRRASSDSFKRRF